MGIINGAKLDAKVNATSSSGTNNIILLFLINVTTATIIKIALQLPSSERLQCQFAANTTLSAVLQQFAVTVELPIKINYMTREVYL